MNERGEIKHYTLEKIKVMFKHVKKNNRITDAEFKIFCEGIRRLPSEDVDKVYKDVYFVLLTSHKKPAIACWVHKKELGDKKGIIFFTPSFFKYDAVEAIISSKIRKKKIIRNEQQFKILHEVAHYHFGHGETPYHKNQELEAESLAELWFGIS